SIPAFQHSSIPAFQHSSIGIFPSPTWVYKTTMARATVADVLGPAGELAKLVPGWESRPQQLAMAELVAQGLAAPSHVICEAPTGVGKSFAYLVPIIQHALATGTKVVISTATIALQEQLVRKDIPQLQQIFPELKAVLVKGRQNYVSLRRLGIAHDGQQALFETREEVHALRQIHEWVDKEAEIGDKEELGWDPSPGVWRQIGSDRNNCQGRKCPEFGSCFFYAARQRMEGAQLLVVNHHLYFSDLGLREEAGGILPSHGIVVFDEAHALEDVATDHLGVEIGAAQVRWFLDTLWSGRGKGLLADPRRSDARDAVEAARRANEDLWLNVARLCEGRSEDTVRIAAANPIENPLSPALDALAQALECLKTKADDDNESTELTAQGNRALELAGGLRRVLEGEDSGLVCYATVPRERRAPSLSARPLSVADLLKEQLFDRMKTVVLTSATLAADDSARFLFLRRRLGLEGGLAKLLDSPFDYKTQAKLLLNESPIDPNKDEFVEATARWLARYVLEAEGGIFVLFTSYRQLQAVHDRVRPALDRLRRFVLRHGDGMARSQMIELFKRTGDAVLFGTSSFWEGVDVPGNALRHVVIAKLPFEVPNHPVVEARLNEIRKRGGNPFVERQVPEAILRLKQGFGRLIRTRTDTGTVAILDHRICTASYGRYFLKALPPCDTTVFRLADELVTPASAADERM
ncbi:MAG: helicase C-terminal domain-containing protein, partial [Planctomycetota bacterium]